MFNFGRYCHAFSHLYWSSVYYHQKHCKGLFLHIMSNMMISKTFWTMPIRILEFSSNIFMKAQRETSQMNRFHESNINMLYYSQTYSTMNATRGHVILKSLRGAVLLVAWGHRSTVLNACLPSNILFRLRSIKFKSQGFKFRLLVVQSKYLGESRVI